MMPESPEWEALADSGLRLVPSDTWAERRDAVLRDLRGTGGEWAVQRASDARLLLATLKPGAISREPIVITGPPRSGTGFLHELFALDPALHWEARGHGLDWPAHVHEGGYMMPAADDEIMAPAFGPPFWSSLGDFDHGDVEKAIGHAIMYWEEHLARWDDGRRWVTRSPLWATTVPGLLAITRPEAVVVHLHRDPAEWVPSAWSQLRATRAVYDAEPVMPLDDDWEAMVSVLNHPCPRDVDVSFKALVEDPVGTMAELYYDLQPLGLRWTVERAARVAEWAAASTSRPQRKHSYKLQPKWRAQLEPYVERNKEYLT
jgi:hypothetical protein